VLFSPQLPPDGPLSALRVGTFPASLRGPLLREAARACAKYVEGGGRLTRIDEHASRFQQGHLILMPLPAAARPLPPPEEMDLDLRRLWGAWDDFVPAANEATRFYLRFCRELGKRAPVVRAHARLVLREEEKRNMQRAVDCYRAARHTAPLRDAGSAELTGCWAGRPGVTLAQLHEAVRALREHDTPPLHGSARAELFRGTLFGEDLIVKIFAPNPRPWRKNFGPSRARLSWAGSRVLRDMGLACPEVLGFLEILRGGMVEESVVLHRPVPDAIPLHAWLRKNYARLTADDRRELRHLLREEILKLHRRGILHLDSKLLNLLVREHPGRLEFTWIDLEDIRARRRISDFALVRNLYQINGSIPRKWPREERLAFLRGFRSRHPGITHPLVVAWITRKTRKRLRRELNRICKP